MKATAYLLYISAIWLCIRYNVSPELIAWLTILMLADTILGMFKAWRVARENSAWFSSRKLKVWVVSKSSILVLILCLWFVTKVVLPTSDRWDNLVSVVLWLLCVAEFISIIQNTIVIRTWTETNEYDAISRVLSWLLEKMKNAIDTNVQ